MKLESCKTILQSYSMDSILVLQIDTSGSNCKTDSITRITACNMNGDQILNTDDVKNCTEEIKVEINKYNAVIGVDVFTNLIPFLKENGIVLNCDCVADLQKEWDEIIGSYNSKSKTWNRVSLPTLAGLCHFHPQPNLYSHHYNRVFAYALLALKASEINSYTLSSNRKSLLRMQNNITNEHPIF